MTHLGLPASVGTEYRGRKLTSFRAAALRANRGVPALAPAEARDRWIRRRVAMVWGLLILNALTFYPGYTLVLPIPHRIGQLITQGSLFLALFVALTANRRVVIRPNVFLCLVSLLVIEAFMLLAIGQTIGTIYRTFRLAEFVTALWLISPWWGRRDLLLLRYHLTALLVVLGSVLVGLMLRPNAAMAEGRLSGVFWPIPSTEVAHYAAVATGLVVVLWFGGLLRGRATLFVVVVAVTMLVLTHTRTALIGMVTGILVAGLSLIVVKARVRRFFATAVVVVSIGLAMAAGVVTTWLARGQNSHELVSLTGRTDFWSLVLNLPRDRFQVIFGFGLSNGSVNGLPIDSNWLVAYMQQGLFGVIVCVTMLLFLLVNSFFQPPGIKRALALFLTSYAIVASVTEVGFTDATIYLLELTVAASLLVPSVVGRRQE